MLKILLRKQLLEINRALFVNPKTGKKRSPAGVVALIALYVLLLGGTFGGLFTILAAALVMPLAASDALWLYYAVFVLLAIVCGVFGSVLTSYASMYLSKDNDLLLSMPIPVRDILLSRLLGVYVMGLLFSGVVVLPATVVCFVMTGSVPALFGGLFLLLCVSLFVLVLAAILGYGVARISLHIKNKSLAVTVLSLLFIAVYYYAYFQAETLIEGFLEYIAATDITPVGAMRIFFWLGAAGEGNLLAVLLTALVVGALVFVTYKILARNFIKTATASAVPVTTGKKSKIEGVGSVHNALLFKKELGRFLGSPSYLLNTGLGVIFLFALAVFIIIKAGDVSSLFSILESEGIFGAERFIPAVAFAVIGFCGSMDAVCAASVSMEGKTLYITNTLPVSPRAALLAKVELQLLVNLPASLVAYVTAWIVFAPPVAEAVVALLLTVVFNVFTALLGLTFNLLFPNLTWQNETVAVKQGTAVLFTLLANMALIGLTVGVVLGCGLLFGSLLPLTGFLILFSLATVLLALWVCKRGAAIYQKL